MNKGVLEGVRVADFTQLWAGSYATAILALMGAEVIKIETKKKPDPSRLLSLTTRQLFKGYEESVIFNYINLNKLDVVLDLKLPKGVELAKRIVEQSDIVAQNFRPGVMDRLGLGYEDLKKVKPDIIYLSSSALGATGPDRLYGGYAPTFSSLSGVAHLTGYEDGKPYPMMGRVDLLSALTSSFSIIAALNYKQRTGKGQHIDVSSTESISVAIGDVLMDYTMNQREKSREGNKDEIMAPHNCYRCKGEDKWISIAISTEDEWKAFCKALGNPDWTKDEKFQDAYLRKKNESELDQNITNWTMEHTHYEAMHILQKAGVAAVPSFSSEELYKDPHINDREIFVDIEHPVMGKRTVVGLPWKVPHADPITIKHAPLLGQHNEYVFGELLGMSKEEISKLMEEKIIY